MNETRITELKWEKIRPTEELRSRLDQAAKELTPRSGGKFHIITHPFGKIFVCQSSNLLFFHVGDGGRPSEILPLAITTDAASRVLAPTRRPEDFDECCESLGIQGEDQRERFWKFLLPGSKSSRSAVRSRA